MKRIQINTTDKYEVLISEGPEEALLTLSSAREDKVACATRLMAELEQIFKGLISKPTKCAILWDEGINPAPVEILGDSLEKMGISCVALSVEGGESCKTMETYGRVIAHLENMGLDRFDLIVGVGGGSVLDLAGFTAATYLRGLTLINVPTTLLSMVDASVGGKNSLNFNGLKNRIGTFKQPKLVIVEPSWLGTITDKEFKSGAAEIIKVAAVSDREMFGRLLEKPVTAAMASKDAYDSDRAYLLEMILKAIEFKAELVAEDEEDHGKRLLLNFGHTFGHAIESRSNYVLPHGNCVAIGMVFAAKYSLKYGADQSVLDDIKLALKKHGLPTDSPVGMKNLMKAVRRDKKAHGGEINMVLLNAIGDAYVKSMTSEDFQ